MTRAQSEQSKWQTLRRGTRIIYLHQYFTTPEMNGGVRSFEFARRLASAGYDVQVITSDRAQDAARGWRVQELAGFTIHWVGVPYSNSMNFLSRVAAFIHFVVRASAHVIGMHADVVFATSTPLTIALPAIVAKVMNRAHLIFEVRDLWPEVPIAMGVLRNPFLVFAANLLERLAYYASDHIIALSPGMKNGVVGKGYSADLVTVIPNSADVDLLFTSTDELMQWKDEFPSFSSRKFVLYCGTLGAVNGVGYLADIAAEARKFDPDLAFVVVGDGRERLLIERLARDLEVLDVNFFMVGNVAKSDVRLFFAGAAMTISLCVPIRELENNSANKFFDSLAAGKPIVINYGGWQKEIIEQNSIGIVIPSDSPQEAARQLVSLAGLQSALTEMSARAALLGKTVYSRDSCFKAFREVIESVVDKRL